MYNLTFVLIRNCVLVDNASELLVSLSSGNLEDFYPSAAIASLMKILKDPSLSQHHTMVIQVPQNYHHFYFSKILNHKIKYSQNLVICIYIIIIKPHARLTSTYYI